MSQSEQTLAAGLRQSQQLHTEQVLPPIKGKYPYVPTVVSYIFLLWILSILVIIMLPVVPSRVFCTLQLTVLQSEHRVSLAGLEQTLEQRETVLQQQRHAIEAARIQSQQHDSDYVALQQVRIMTDVNIGLL